FGGTLLIEGANRLPDVLLDELLDELEALSRPDIPRVLLTVDTARDAARSADEIPREMEDLAERAGGAAVVVARVREHAEDLGSLAEYLMPRSEMRHDKLISGLDQTALDELVKHDWPGNQRELREVIERAVLVCDGRELTPEHL